MTQNQMDNIILNIEEDYMYFDNAELAEIIEPFNCDDEIEYIIH